MIPRFKLGDKVKIRRTWSDIDGALGIIAAPPDTVRGKFGSDYFKEETSLTGSTTIIYWVEFGLVDGTTEADEFDASELEKV